MELLNYLPILRKWWWLLLLGTLMATFAGYLFFITFTPWPQYEAKTTIMVTGDENMSADTVQTIIATYSELVAREPITQRVVDDLNLSMTSDELEKLITVTPIGYTRLMEISVIYSDPVTAAYIANEIASQVSRVRLSSEKSGMETIAKAQVPTRPNLGVYVGLFIAGLTGLFVSGGAVLLLEYLNGRINTAQDIEKRLHLLVLGELDMKANQSVLEKNFQWLAFNIDHSLKKSSSKLLLATPESENGDIKVAVGLAKSWVARANKVVLVDAYTVPPIISQWFGFEESENGRFSPKTISQQPKPIEIVSAEKTVQTSEPPDANNQIVDVEQENILDELVDYANVVLVNGAPILSAPHAARLTAFVDGVILLIHAQKSRYDHTKKAVTMIEKAGGNVLGAVLLS